VGDAGLKPARPKALSRMEGAFLFSFGWKDMKMIIFKGVRDRFAETTKNNAKNMHRGGKKWLYRYFFG